MAKAFPLQVRSFTACVSRGCVTDTLYHRIKLSWHGYYAYVSSTTITWYILRCGWWYPFLTGFTSILLSIIAVVKKRIMYCYFIIFLFSRNIFRRFFVFYSSTYPILSLKEKLIIRDYIHHSFCIQHMI